MKDTVVLVSDTTVGGAATSCRRLYSALKPALGDRVKWVVASGSGERDVVVASDWPDLMPQVAYRLACRFIRDDGKLRQFGSAVSNRSVFECVRRLKPSVVHLHGLHEGLSFGLVERLAPRYPLVWTMHDMWPLTGYCYYSYECDAYREGCRRACPQWGRCGALSRSPEEEWIARQRVLNRFAGSIRLVGPSRWMAECAEARFKGRPRVECIPYGLDLTRFKPLPDRKQVRQVLGLPAEPLIVLAGAEAVGDRRKGLGNLGEVISAVSHQLGRDVQLVVVGGRERRGELKSGAIEVGKVRDEAFINLYYNAADAFVLPTMADNLPNMLVESIAAGTPAATYDIGGCRDVVRDRETGYLAPAGSLEGLVEALRKLLCDVQNNEEAWRTRCRTNAENRYDERIQADRYLSLYAKMAKS